MKVLVSTTETQGWRKNDFCHVPEGELVTWATECDGEAVDGKCGCRRAMIGLESRCATTTFKVVDLPMSEVEYSAQLTASLKAGGWDKLFEKNDLRELVAEDQKDLLRMAALFPVGLVIEKRGTKIQVRRATFLVTIHADANGDLATEDLPPYQCRVKCATEAEAQRIAMKHYPHPLRGQLVTYDIVRQKIA